MKKHIVKHNALFLGALCPSKSGLLNKHIVKHIVKHFWEAETIPLEMAGAVVVV
jgi:hypothetical protein